MDPAFSYPAPHTWGSDPESSSPEAIEGQAVPETSCRKILRVQDTFNAEDAEWKRHKEEIIRLYWEEDLPAYRVQEIMMREHGFNKSLKMYKYRFKRWGIRKNIKKQEALELAQGHNRSSKFWPDARSPTYHHRIARHVRRRAGGRGQAEPRCIAHQDWTTVTPPARICGPDILEALEKAFYCVDVYLGDTGTARHSQWFSRPPALESGEKFFDLFVQGMEDLSRNVRTEEAFSGINSAFASLKGLIASDHPLIYYRIASRIASCKVYPSAQVCVNLCRLLADYCLQMTRVLHGESHPLLPWWTLQIKVLESGDVNFLENFMEIARMQSGKHLVAGKGLVHVAMYVPSDARDQDEESLRYIINTLPQDPDRISEVQEARLALVERLLGEERLKESLPFLETAIAFKHLDPYKPSSRAFWISELLWGAGMLERSMSVLRETVQLVKVEEDIAPARADEELSYIGVLQVLRGKLEWLKWELELRQVNDMLAPLMMRRGRPLKIRFVSSDLEVDFDARYRSCSPSTSTASPSLPIRQLGPGSSQVY